MIEFQIQDEGDTVKTDVTEALGFLRESGINVTQVGQDGLTAFVQGPDGQMQQSHMVDLLAQAGLDVAGLKPMQANNELFNPKYRFLTERLSNDEQKKQLLTMELEADGIKNPTIIGSGEDWYAFDPRAQQYFALTNIPGLDVGDIVEGIGTVGKGTLGTLGAVAGLGLGAPAGPAALAVGGAGGALGSAAGEGLLQGLAASISPAYREVQTLRGALPQLAEDAAWGAGFGALGGAAAWGKAALPGMIEAGQGGSTLAKTLRGAQQIDSLLGMGVGSTAARATGGVAEAGGALVSETAGRIAGSPLAKSVATSLTPGLGQMQLAGFAAQAPRWVAQAGAKAPGWIGRQLETLRERSPFVSELVPQEVAQGMQNWTKNVMRRRPGGILERAEEALEKSNLRARGFSEEEIAARFSQPRTADVLANSLRKASIRIAPRDRILDAARVSQAAGRYAGTGMDRLAQVGKAMESGAENILGTGLRTAEFAGRQTSNVGRGLKNLGTALQPYENRATARILAEEQMPEWMRKLKRSTGLNQPNVSRYPGFAQE